MHHAARILAASVTFLAVCVPSAPAEAVLELPADWYGVVRPYRYVEARRFERGWNRGADVVVPAGRVRTPVAGTVRFAGGVAGRTVVTIDAIVDGDEVVVTFTGLGERAVRTGERLRAGELVGSGRYVHIGAYDPDRRTRYLPVRASTDRSSTGAADSGARVASTRDGTLSGAIAARLEDAIVGSIAAWTGPSVRNSVDAQRGSPAPTVGAARPTVDGGEVQYMVKPRGSSGAAPRVTWTGPASLRAAGTRTATTIGTAWGRVPSASVVHGSVWASWARGSYPGVSGIDLDLDAAATRKSPSAWTSHGGLGRNPRSRSSGASVDAGRSPVGVHVATIGHESDAAEAAPIRAGRDGVDAKRHEEIRADGWQAVRSALAVALAVLLPLLALARRRRRCRGTVRESRVREPLPVLLPHVRPYSYPVVRTDGSSILPDIALAWPDADPGTSPGPEPRERAREREPEHA